MIAVVTESGKDDTRDEARGDKQEEEKKRKKYRNDDE